VIFHSYVKLPEGNQQRNDINRPSIAGYDLYSLYIGDYDSTDFDSMNGKKRSK
jgi:hypothetical protein